MSRLVAQAPDVGQLAADGHIRRVRQKIGGRVADGPDTFLHRSGDELRAVVRPDIAGCAPQDEEVGQQVEHRRLFELAINPERQTLPREHIDDVEHAVLAPVMGSIFDEVV